MTTAAPAARPGPWRLDATRFALVAVLFALAAGAWWLTGERMRGMATGPTADLGGLGFYAGTWVAMMAAMMFPSVWPVVALYDSVRSRRGTGASATAALIGGYLAAWTSWGLAAFGAIAAGAAVVGDRISWEGTGHWLAAGIVAAAGVYQLTPLKDACLRRCRGPLMFVMENWRGGRYGALRMGALHGAWCVGCCWGLMAALFALGAMSVGWMAFVAGLIATEKLLPWPRVAKYAIAAMLLVIAIGLAVDPAALPGMPGESGSEAMPMGGDGHRMR